MADDATDDTTTEPPEGAEDQTTDQDEQVNEEQSSWDEFLESLNDEQAARVRAHVKGKSDKLDSDLRKLREETRDVRRLKAEMRDLRRRAQDAEAKAAQVDEVEDKRKTAEQRVDEMTATARQENEALRRRLVSQEIKVQAAALFADPDDPAELLAGQVADLMDTDLEPDGDAISDALKELLERKPHLAKRETAKPRPPAPTKAQGTSGSSTSAPGSKGAAEAARRFGQKQAS